MTVEVDALINYVRSTGVSCVVTDVSTPGVHTPYDPKNGKYGNHYAPGTPSQSGDKGLAIDFAFKHSDGRHDCPELLAIFRILWDQKEKLQELYYSGPGVTHMVRFGGVTKIGLVPKSIIDAHHNHIHVAVHRGTFLVPAIPALIQPATINQIGDDMPQPTDKVSELVYPDGSKTVLLRNGSIINAGTPFFGTIHNIADEFKRDWTEALTLTAVDPQDASAGYVCWATSGKPFKFDPPTWIKIEAQ